MRGDGGHRRASFADYCYHYHPMNPFALALLVGLLVVSLIIITLSVALSSALTPVVVSIWLVSICVGGYTIGAFLTTHRSDE